ncbi:MAG: ABC transporter ATP-binding protein [Pseudomonadota bacterium]
MNPSGTHLRATRISVSTQQQTLLHPSDFTLRTGELVVLLGPNGAGKTTLLRRLLGLHNFQQRNLLHDGQGEVCLNEQNIEALSPAERARLIAYLPQERPMAWPNRVRDVVALGRYAHGVSLGNLSAADAHAVQQALDACQLTSLADRRIDTLSGGETARVHCARVYAADTPLLIADEPTTSLDPLHQHNVLTLLRSYADNGHGVLVVLHDVNLAFRYADRMVWMQQGRIVADEPPQAVTEARLKAVYGTSAMLQSVPISERDLNTLPQVVFGPGTAPGSPPGSPRGAPREERTEQ